MANITQYKKEYCQLLIDHMSQGYSFGSFGGDIGVTRKTLYNWLKEFDEFREAKEIGYKKALKMFESRLLAKVSGQKLKNVDPKLIDTACLIFGLKTRFHKDYGEQQKEQGSISLPESYEITISSKTRESDGTEN